ncbi:MAG: PEGA domain-containing protein [Bacteroidetes bacterium]|nr:PEGA domain-containing protein [Bacteroidota bacterium]
MKKLIFLLLIPFAALVISSCDTTNDSVTPTEPGSIFVTSNPAGAQIWLDGVNTSQVTPDTIKNVDEGVHNITLKLQEFSDTTFTISVTAGQMITVPNVVLVSNIMTTLFGPVRIYETAGTTAQQPSGLDLSSGEAWGVSSDSSGLVDIYYFSDSSGTSFLVQSADVTPKLIRETDFVVGSSDNLFDEEDSPDKNDGTWTNNIGDREANYVFLYDHDGHYSKLKIVSWGGGQLGEPAWVEVLYYYNNTVLDKRF